MSDGGRGRADASATSRAAAAKPTVDPYPNSKRRSVVRLSMSSKPAVATSIETAATVSPTDNPTIWRATALRTMAIASKADTVWRVDHPSTEMHWPERPRNSNPFG
jgi:hypothetical protein